MDTVGPHLKGEFEPVAYDEGSGVVRAQRLQMRNVRNHAVKLRVGAFDAQHEPRDAPHVEGGIQLPDQPRRVVTEGADQQELAARLGRIDRLVQGASSGLLMLR
jgi:hypothetical protein